MHHASIFGRQLQSAIFEPEDTESASAVICQPRTDNCEASAQTEQSEPRWNDSASVRQSLPRPLTRAQSAFVDGVARGETYKAAYRAAYPGDSSTDAGISTSAYRLLKDPRIQKALRDAQEDAPERLLDDPAAMKRYVLTQLLRCASQFKQEGSKIKALELVGRATGVFRPEVEPEAPSVSSDQLKRELSQHLTYLDSADHCP